MQFDYFQLAALAAVAREGSFERAAASLHVTPSAVSQRVKGLEDGVGRLLVVRGRPCTLTPDGDRLHRHALQVGLLESDLSRELRAGGGAPRRRGSAVPAPLVVIAANADSLATWLLPALAPFAEATGARLKIEVDDQDHTAEWLRSGRVLGAVTAEARPVQGCAVEPLGVMRYRATASPAFVKRWFPQGVTRDALRLAPALLFDRKDQLEHRFIRRALGLRPVPLSAHWIPSSTAFVEASLLNLGWGVNPEPLVEAHVQAGRLRDIVPGRRFELPLYWQHWRLTSELLSSLSAALLAGAKRSLR